jgi:hypothetical protein
VDLGKGGEFWIELGAAQEVQRDEGLDKKAIPKVKRKFLVGAAGAQDKMVNERANGMFSIVTAVQVGRSELGINVFGTKEGFEDWWAFIVKLLENGAEASVDEDDVRPLIGCKDSGASFIFHGFSMNAITVIVI